MDELTTLTAANRAALEWVRARARPHDEDLGPRFARAQVTVNFHPDRRISDGRSVAEALLVEGVYRNQFETGISNGLLGRQRTYWENRAFGPAYLKAEDWERPKYGGLNVHQDLNGACPGFGPCHLRLRAHTLARTTLTYGDSVDEPDRLGFIDAFEPVLRPLRAVHSPLLDARRATMNHDVNEYIEAQIHGIIELAADVEAVVIDPAYQDTPTGERLLAAAEHFGFHDEWHEGTVIDLDDFPIAPPDHEFEWHSFLAAGNARRLAHKLAGDGPLTAAHLGVDDEDPQELKYLWRLMATYGRPPV